MPRFVITAKVNQLVTKTVGLEVIAADEETAVEKAKEVLSVYPAASEVPAVKKIVTVKSTYWIPRDIEFEDVRKELESA